MESCEGLSDMGAGMNEPLPKWMPCGNTAALRQHEAWQSRKIEPTSDDLERFAEKWIENKRDRIGHEFIYEAVSESDVSRLYAAWDDPHELGNELQRLIVAYWEPQALKAAESHDWNKEYRERME